MQRVERVQVQAILARHYYIPFICNKLQRAVLNINKQVAAAAAAAAAASNPMLRLGFPPPHLGPAGGSQMAALMNQGHPGNRFLLQPPSVRPPATLFNGQLAAAAAVASSGGRKSGRRKRQCRCCPCCRRGSRCEWRKAIFSIRPSTQSRPSRINAPMHSKFPQSLPILQHTQRPHLEAVPRILHRHPLVENY